jgi:hypothetical protein
LGANYDMILVAGASQSQVVDSVTAFLQQQGYCKRDVVSHDTFLENRPEQTDMVCFIGPQRGDGWLPVVANCSTLRVSLSDWFNTNPLARHLSMGTRASIHIWSQDSGFAAGYSMFLQGQQQETRTVFWAGASQRPSLLMPNVPVPEYHGSTTLGNVLNKPEFDYGAFVSGYRNLEHATAAIADSFGVLEQLCDFDHLARGKDAMTIFDKKYLPISLSDEWVVIIYERATST